MAAHELLTEEVKVRVSGTDKAWLREEAKRHDRSEGAIVRAALRHYREHGGAAGKRNGR